MSAEQFTIFGTKYRCGSYLLLIHLSKPIQLAFGRFQQRKLFTLPEGEYLYIGSALGKSGSPLAQRLLRHASRSYAQQPHAIRAPMVTLFMQEGLIEKQALNAHEKKSTGISIICWIALKLKSSMSSSSALL